MNPTLLTDDSADHLTETAGEERRREATLGRAWQGKPLLWTIGRQSLYFWLRTPPPPLSDEALAAVRAAKAGKGSESEAALKQAADLALAESQQQSGPDQTRYRNALIVLFLAVHTPADWQAFTHDRKRFLNAVESWADATLPPSTDAMLEVAEITDLLLEDAEVTRAIPLPKRSDPDTAGN